MIFKILYLNNNNTQLSAISALLLGKEENGIWNENRGNVVKGKESMGNLNNNGTKGN